MDYPSEECRNLLLQAEAYEGQTDHYNAIKLYKRAIRLAPHWLPPYERLCQVYKNRREWKAVVHYNKKVVALDPTRAQHWWDLGIGAAATGRRRLARRIWHKFGHNTGPNFGRKPLTVQLRHSGMYELVWARPLDPARVVLESIPHPDSDRSFQDILLMDKEQVGTTIVGNRRLPIYPELDLLKRSHYHTWSCQLTGAGTEDVQLLENLCREAALGFEVWSNAQRSLRLSGQREYYAQHTHRPDYEDGVLVAIAGKREKNVVEVLRSWKVISLKEWHDLERHR